VYICFLIKIKIMKKILFFIFLSFQGFINSQTWLPSLGQGVDDAPYAFTEAIIEFEGDIIITGEFASVSGVPVAYVARWNGSSWESMGNGLPAVGKCLAVYNGELYAGLDGIGVSTLQKWNGTSWVASGPFQNPILTLYVDPVSNTFYAGGYFTSPGKYVAKLNGSTWVGVGNLTAGSSSFPGVKAISVYNNDLYVGGTFGGGSSVQYVAKYNGSSFVSLSANQPNQVVNSLVQKDGLLFLGGAFSRVGPSGSPLTPSVISYDGSSWVPLTDDMSGPINSEGGVNKLIVYKNQIYAVGTFVNIFSTDLETNNIARWNDCKWKSLDDGNTPIGINGQGLCLAVINDDLYVGGHFTQAGNVVGSKRIATWRGITECPDQDCFPLTPSITISTTQTTTCTGSTVLFNSSVVNGGSTPTYQWKVNGVNSGTNSSSFSMTAVAGSQTVTCDVTSNDPCMINPTNTSNSIVINVVSEIVPTVSITSSPSSACSGEALSFSSTITGGGSAPMYQWQVDGVNVGTNSANYSSVLNNAQSVTCTLTSSESCANPSSVTSNSITTSVTQTPSDEVTMTSSSLTATQAGATYQWLNCLTGNSAITAAINQTFTPTQTGSYAVLITIGNCSVTSSCNNFDYVGFEELDELNFQILPNPSNGEFMIQTSYISDFKIKVTDISGKLILTKDINTADNLFNLTNNQSGVYFVEFDINGIKYYKKIIKN
jgi:hypothetical protein